MLSAPTHLKANTQDYLFRICHFTQTIKKDSQYRGTRFQNIMKSLLEDLGCMVTFY